nr:hypothetical protein [Sphingobium sp. 15-1]
MRRSPGSFDLIDDAGPGFFGAVPQRQIRAKAGGEYRGRTPYAAGCAGYNYGLAGEIDHLCLP